MQKWEYATLRISAKGFFSGGGEIDTDALGSALTRAGSEGWEVCGVVETNKFDGQTRDVIVMMKRPLNG